MFKQWNDMSRCQPKDMTCLQLSDCTVQLILISIMKNEVKNWWRVLFKLWRRNNHNIYMIPSRSLLIHSQPLFVIVIAYQKLTNLILYLYIFPIKLVWLGYLSYIYMLICLVLSFEGHINIDILNIWRPIKKSGLSHKTISYNFHLSSFEI